VVRRKVVVILMGGEMNIKVVFRMEGKLWERGEVVVVYVNIKGVGMGGSSGVFFLCTSATVIGVPTHT